METKMTNFLEFAISHVLKITEKDSPILLEVRNNKLFVATKTNFHKLILESNFTSPDFRAVISSEIAREAQSMLLGDFELHEDFIQFKNKSNKTKIALLKDNISLMDLARGYEKNNNAVFDGIELRDAFFYTKHASNDKSIGDVVLRGFHLTLNESSAEIMASNGAILSLVKVNQKDIEFSKNQVLILNPDFFSLIKTFGDEEVKVGFNENMISLTQTTENFTLRAVSALVSGKQPLPYDTVIKAAKSNVKLSCVVTKKSFIDAVKDVKVFSPDNKSTLKLYKTGELEIKADGSRGEAVREIEVSSIRNPNDENFEVRLNVEYLLNYLSGNKSELISVGFSEPLAPIVFEDSYGVEVLAPLRN